MKYSILLLTLICGRVALAAECTAPDYEKIEKVLSRPMAVEASPHMIVQIGADPEDTLKQLADMKANNPCWENFLSQETDAKGDIAALEKYAAEPFADKYALPEAQCTKWHAGEQAKQNLPQILQWDFAYEAANLLSHEFDKSIAPFELAANWAKSGNTSDPLHNADVRADKLPFRGKASEVLAINREQDKGLCLMSNFNLGEGAEKQKNMNQLETLIHKITEDGNAEAVAKAISDNRVLFKNLKAEEIAAVVRPARKLDRLQVLFEKSCKERTDYKLTTMSAVLSYKKDSEEIGRTLDLADAKLNRKDPVGIAFRARGFGGSFLNSGIKTAARGSGGDIPDHTAAIIGREFRNGRCEYLVQDPAVNDCKYVASSLSCDKATGSTWVPRTTLVNAVVEVDRLEMGGGGPSQLRNASATATSNH